MMFVDDGDFFTLSKREKSRWDEVLQQYQRTVNEWIGFLRVSEVNINLEKEY